MQKAQFLIISELKRIQKRTVLDLKSKLINRTNSHQNLVKELRNLLNIVREVKSEPYLTMAEVIQLIKTETLAHHLEESS